MFLCVCVSWWWGGVATTVSVCACADIRVWLIRSVNVQVKHKMHRCQKSSVALSSGNRSTAGFSTLFTRHFPHPLQNILCVAGACGTRDRRTTSCSRTNTTQAQMARLPCACYKCKIYSFINIWHTFIRSSVLLLWCFAAVTFTDRSVLKTRFKE